MLIPNDVNQVITVRGTVASAELGRVMMHEHLHADLYDWEADEVVKQEKPCAPKRRQLLMNDAVPLLKTCTEEHGMHAFVDATMPPWRAWPDVYSEISEASGVHIILCTGFYREIETDTYFVKTSEDAIWTYVRDASLDELTAMCVREIIEGIHGTSVRAGAIKLGTSQAPMTDAEIKTFKAGARAQKQTGVHITTHCTRLGAETSQLAVLDEEGVDLTRVVIGHTAHHLMNSEYRRTVLEWMKRGANFMPTNLNVTHPDDWQPLINAFHQVFDAGYGDKLCLGLDSGYCSEAGPFARVNFMPPPPWLYMFTHVLPTFRDLGLTDAEEDALMRVNPQRLIPVR